MWRAKQLGTYEHFGWGSDTYLLAGIANTVRAMAKGKRLSPTERVKPPEVTRSKPKNRQKFNPALPVAQQNYGALFPS